MCRIPLIGIPDSAVIADERSHVVRTNCISWPFIFSLASFKLQAQVVFSPMESHRHYLHYKSPDSSLSCPILSRQRQSPPTSELYLPCPASGPACSFQPIPC
ncbi:Efflux pump FUS6 [Fusarium oxysporum f. sp. albedinis]|nr:Efflux pump FUS6 [Fusarium oxysporum f. sp. albedinis]